MSIRDLNRAPMKLGLVCALAFGVAGCIISTDEPLCCVEIDPGEPIQALSCESEDAVINCMAYDFSDCYRDRARNDECN